MNLPPPTGSPIIARIQNNSKLPVILGIAAIIVVLIVVIGEIIKRIQTAYARTALTERQRMRPTNKADIAAAAKEYSLSGEEAKLLYEICKKHKVPNVRFFLQDYEQTASLFKTVYQTAASGDDAEHTLSLFFSMYGKICRNNMALSVITSTMALRAGQKMLYIDSDGKKFPTSVVESTESELVIATPKDKAGNDIMLQSLTKINLMIQGKNDVAFSCSVRVIRNQMQMGEPVVIVTHSNQFETFLRHEYVYIPARISCQLQAAVTMPDPKRSADAVLYDTQGRTYNGIMLNYSGTSCNILVKNSIKVRQLLQVTTTLNGCDVDKMIVMVMNVVENRENRVFLLHANFVKLTAKTKNYILSYVYSFADTNGNAGKFGAKETQIALS